MAAQVLLAAFTSVKLPDMPMPWGRVHMIGGIAALALLVLKLLAETDFLGFGSYLGILLAGGLAYGGFTMDRESKAAGAM